MKTEDIVKFKVPANEEEEKSLMVVMEMRGDRVLVGDLRFSNWDIPPTNVYVMNDLEVVINPTKTKMESS